jgi:hypothetical protein
MGGSQGAEIGGRLTPPPPRPHPLHRLLRTLTWNGFLPPPPSCLCGSPGNAFEPFFLLSCALPFICGAAVLPPRHILGQGEPPWVAAHASKTLQHERSRCQKRQKLTQSSGNKPKQTHPGAGNPVPLVNQARAGASVYPESKDPLDPGVNLHIC